MEEINTETKIAEELIANVAEIAESEKIVAHDRAAEIGKGGAEVCGDEEVCGAEVCADEEEEKKIFRKFKIKDVVFLAIITACTLVTGAIMPLLVHVPMFGIIQLGLGLQFSLFPVIGMMKVRKAGSLLLLSIFLGVILAFMFWPMAPCLVISGLVAEGIAQLVFRGYRSDRACVLAGTLYMPLTLPTLYVFLNYVWVSDGGAHEAIDAYLHADAAFVAGIAAAVVALCFVGAWIGKMVSRELIKAGKFRK